MIELINETVWVFHVELLFEDTAPFYFMFSW